MDRRPTMENKHPGEGETNTPGGGRFSDTIFVFALQGNLKG